jgi:hypothetical protein
VVFFMCFYSFESVGVDRNEVAHLVVRDLMSTRKCIQLPAQSSQLAILTMVIVSKYCNCPFAATSDRILEPRQITKRRFV